MESEECESQGSVLSGTPKVWEVLYQGPTPPQGFPPEVIHPYNPVTMRSFRDAYPTRDPAWTTQDAIQRIHKDSPLGLVSMEWLSLPGCIFSMSLSPHYTFLAACSSAGVIKVWETHSWRVVGTYFLDDERAKKHIFDFYTVEFSEDCRRIAVSGKRKLRDFWDETENDCKITDCPILIFDLKSHEIVAEWSKHTEEVFRIRRVLFKDEVYLVSCGFDGTIVKWFTNDAFGTTDGGTVLYDGDTGNATDFQFLPNTGNKYLVAACDGVFRIFDFEQGSVIQAIVSPYQLYIDSLVCLDGLLDEDEDDRNNPDTCWLFSRGIHTETPAIQPKKESSKKGLKPKKKDSSSTLSTSLSASTSPLPSFGSGPEPEVASEHTGVAGTKMDVEEGSVVPGDLSNGMPTPDTSAPVDVDSIKKDAEKEDKEALKEVTGEEEEKEFVGPRAGAHMFRVIYPKRRGEEFEIRLIRSFDNPEYHAVSWPLRLGSNGRYVCIPGMEGEFHVWNIATGTQTAVIREHKRAPVRQIMFFPNRPLLLSCGDDGSILVYTTIPKQEEPKKPKRK